MNTLLKNIAMGTLVLVAMPMTTACDTSDDGISDSSIERQSVLTTADDVAKAVADGGSLVIDTDDPQTAYHFELGNDPAQWANVSLVVDGELTPFADVLANIEERAGVDVWETGSFGWTSNPDAFGTLDAEQLEQLDRAGALVSDDGDGVPYIGYIKVACPDQGGDWFLCMEPPPV
ncbi:MAG: hypothetical protein K0V04_09010 [Deltaproteobacteria bacterium]|nr:hypothetical protein [Deltaproteobacteria bacterium]